MIRGLPLLALLAALRPPSIEFQHQNSPTADKFLLETMGGGVALLDYNADGLLDIFFVNGAPLPSMRRDSRRYWNRLYRQNPDHTFTDVTGSSGLSQAGSSVYGMGVAAGDYDNDGFPDLFVTGYPRAALFHNNGDGTFTEVTEKAGAPVEGWSASAGFFDYDGDGRLDLFVTRYLDWSPERHQRCGGSMPTYCNPDRFPPVASVLLRNLGGGRFLDVSESSGIAGKPGKGLGVAFHDYDGDGRPDVFVANDGMEQFLFRNLGGGAFQEAAADAGVALSDDGKTYAGMGADFGDYDNDGRADLVVTNLAGEIYALYRNEGGGLFRYASLLTGLARITARSSGWGVRWADFDNDGRKDLFVAQSHVLDNIERISSIRRYLEEPALIWNRGGRFERGELAGAVPVAGRGAAFGDLDNDGWLDVVVGVLGDRPLVFRNPGGRNHWLIVRLVGAKANRDGAGARVEVNGQTGYASTAGSYLSASDPRLHFGLGDKKTARVVVRWPHGGVQTLENVGADQVLTVRESP